jgi:hypothetical protein
VKAPSEVPTLEHVLSTLAFHVAGIMSDASTGERVRTGFGLGGFGECPLVHVDCEIRPSGSDSIRGGQWGVWAQVWLAPHGQPLQCFGNRCGGREELVRLYGPVIAWVAAYHARKSPGVHKATVAA